MRAQPLDFVQVTYNILDRQVEDRILPLARDRGIGVIVNRPFREGELLRKLERHPLPGWTAEIGCESWAQIILKFIVSHPRSEERRVGKERRSQWATDHKTRRR